MNKREQRTSMDGLVEASLHSISPNGAVKKQPNSVIRKNSLQSITTAKIKHLPL